MENINCPACHAPLSIVLSQVFTSPETGAAEADVQAPPAASSEPKPPAPKPRLQTAFERRRLQLIDTLSEWFGTEPSSLWDGYQSPRDIFPRFISWHQEKYSVDLSEKGITKNLVSKALSEMGSLWIKNREGRVYSVPPAFKDLPDHPDDVEVPVPPVTGGESTGEGSAAASPPQPETAQEHIDAAAYGVTALAAEVSAEEVPLVPDLYPTFTAAVDAAPATPAPASATPAPAPERHLSVVPPANLEEPPAAAGPIYFSRPTSGDSIVLSSKLTDKGPAGAPTRWRMMVRVPQDLQDAWAAPDAAHAEATFDSKCPGHLMRSGGVEVRPVGDLDRGLWYLEATIVAKPRPAAEPEPAPDAPTLAEPVGDVAAAEAAYEDPALAEVTVSVAAEEEEAAINQAALDAPVWLADLEPAAPASEDSVAAALIESGEAVDPASIPAGPDPAAAALTARRHAAQMAYALLPDDVLDPGDWG